MVIWVATGGRGTLIGPIIGAGVVNGLKTFLTTTFPEIWLYALGLVFVLVTLFLPQGIVGLARKLMGTKRSPDGIAADAPVTPKPAEPHALQDAELEDAAATR
jgi:urea transport system permease protein